MSPSRLLRHARFLVLLAAGAGIVYLGRRFEVAQVAEDDGGMEPALRAGSRLLVDRRPGLLQRRDVLAVEVDGGRVVPSRVAGLPGDRLEAREGTLHVNGEPVGPAGEQEASWTGRIPEGVLVVVRDRPERSPVPSCERLPLERVRGLVILAWPF